jgi:hypothetical protein
VEGAVYSPQTSPSVFGSLFQKDANNNNDEFAKDEGKRYDEREEKKENKERTKRKELKGKRE